MKLITQRASEMQIGSKLFHFACIPPWISPLITTSTTRLTSDKKLGCFKVVFVILEWGMFAFNGG